MLNLSLEEIASATGGKLLNKSKHSLVSEVSINTETLNKNSLFIPLLGSNVDGHSYVQQSFVKGALCSFWRAGQPLPSEAMCLIVVNDPLVALQQLGKYYLAKLQAKVVAVTGSNGKTTTKDMIGSVLKQKFKVHKTKGNYNNHIGVPLTILSAPRSTEVLILEMGMNNFGEIAFLSQLAQPDYAIITNIGDAHLETLGSKEGIADAKCEIITGLKSEGVLFYYGDEPLLKDKLKHLSHATCSFGAGRKNNYFPLKIKQSIEGTSCIVNGNELFLPCLGQHNVLNGLAAIAVGRQFGLNWLEIEQGLATMEITKMRMEVQKSTNGATMINDAYNANPTAMKAAIELLNDLEGFLHKRIVLSDMYELGSDELQFHREIGNFLDPNCIDFVYTYGEKSAHIAEAAKKEFHHSRVKHFTTMVSLQETLANDLCPEDLILFKGSRAMELEKVILYLV